MEKLDNFFRKSVTKNCFLYNPFEEIAITILIRLACFVFPILIASSNCFS